MREGELQAGIVAATQRSTPAGDRAELRSTSGIAESIRLISAGDSAELKLRGYWSESRNVGAMR